MMNDLIGIIHDVDIMDIPQPSIDDVTSFAAELGPGPKLKPILMGVRSIHGMLIWLSNFTITFGPESP